MDHPQRGRPLAIDHKAPSASSTEPAFVARPEGAPVYHGFVLLDDVVVDGFTLGKITDWEAEPCETGDAFVIAPDGSRAGLVWEICDPPYFQETMPIEADRWGVWSVGFCLPMSSRENARKNLESILPQLKSRWAEWKSRFSPAARAGAQTNSGTGKPSEVSIHESAHAITFDALGEQVERVTIILSEVDGQQLEGHTLLAGGPEKSRPIVAGIAGVLAGPAASFYLCNFPARGISISAFRHDHCSLKSLFDQQGDGAGWEQFWQNLQSFLQSWEHDWVIAQRDVILRFAIRLDEVKTLEGNELQHALLKAWGGTKPDATQLRDRIRDFWNTRIHAKS